MPIPVGALALDPYAQTAEHVTCRGYYDAERDIRSARRKASPALQFQCPQRIEWYRLVDARLLALNAKTGELCADFGDTVAWISAGRRHRNSNATIRLQRR